MSEDLLSYCVPVYYITVEPLLSRPHSLGPTHCTCTSVFVELKQVWIIKVSLSMGMSGPSLLLLAMCACTMSRCHT